MEEGFELGVKRYEQELLQKCSGIGNLICGLAKQDHSCKKQTSFRC